MPWLALLLIAVAFGGMALAFGWSERAEERRILARAEAILARGTIVVDRPADDADAAGGARAADAAPSAARVRSAA